MKPQLGDTVIGRYTLVSSLRESDGLSAWIANDRMLAQSCQLFIITDTSVLPQINEAASTLALANSRIVVAGTARRCCSCSTSAMPRW